MKIETKKPAVDLTDLAIGIVVLGVVVSIGSLVLVNLRDSRLTDLSTVTTANETVGALGYQTSGKLANTWVDTTGAVFEVTNASSIQRVDATNYTLDVSGEGTATITLNGSSYHANETVNVSYTWYNTSSNPDWGIANDAQIGLGEYGSWFKIIVIVGVAAVVLALIFMTFGKSASAGKGISY